MKQTKRFLALLLALIMSLSLLSVGTLAAEGDTVTIDLFSVNDFHGTVDKSASGSNPGADRFVAVVQKLMEENPNSVLLGAGDLYQGSSLSNIFYGEPVSDMLKLLGVEYSALGNHEFDWGLDNIYKFAEDGGITFLAANIFIEGTDEQPDYCEPYAVIEIEGVKIGLIGLITTEVPTLVKAENVEGLEFKEAAEVVPELETYLREDEGCDLVVAVSHLGAVQDAEGVITGEAADLAEAVPTLDGIISGHTHKPVAGEVNGVPVVQGNYNGRGLGRLTFEVDKATGEVVSATPMCYSQNNINNNQYGDESILPNTVVNEEMKEIIAGYSEEIGPFFAQAVGYYGELINTKEEQATWATQIVWDYIYKETGDHYILFQNSGGWRSADPYGFKAADPVTLGYLYTIMPFDNEIVLMDMKGSDLLANLLYKEDNVDITGYKCVAGAYEKDGKWYLTGSDEEIKDDDTLYKVSCNDFMLTGGDKYDFSAKIDDYFMGVPLRDAMIEELQSRVNWADDVNLEAWYKDAYIYSYFNGYMNGNTATTWNPGGNVTRAQVFELFYNLEGNPAVEGDNFPDVAANAWYKDSALWAKEAGLAQGDNGNYKGDRTITRAELATAFANYLDFLGIKAEKGHLAGYPDADKVPSYASEGMSIAVGSGLVTGKNGMLDPLGTATRAELAQIVLNMTGYIDGLDYAVGRVAEHIYGGNLSLDITGKALFDKGFEIGDILTVTIGDLVLDVPLCANYGDVSIAELLVRVPSSSPTREVIVAINMGAFAVTYPKAQVGSAVYFELKEKGGYLEQLELRSIENSRTYERDDYDSDEIYANFREITLGDIAPGVLYRSSSPINNELKRASYADAFCADAGIAAVMNLADTDAKIDGYIAADDFASPYYKSLYDAGSVIALNMGVNFMGDEFGAGLKEGLEFLLENEGPYLVHCTEGKDRAGFVSAVLEALMGATAEEIKEDYMTTYENYFHVEKDSAAYELFADTNIFAMLRFVAGLEKGESLEGVDLAAAANTYLLNKCGLTQTQIDDLKDILSGGANALDLAA